MDTIFENSENSKTSKPYILVLKLTNKLDLRIGEKIITLLNLSIYYTQKNIKSSYNKNKFKISAPTWNDGFGLPDENTESRSTENKITKDKNGENVPHLEITEVVLVHFDIANNDY